MASEKPKDYLIVRGAFGATNRTRLIDAYFSSRTGIAAAGAWEHIYRLLLWVDRSTALAHCYESDKCQPGKNWYGRSLAFHDWVARMFGVEPGQLPEHVDWLFRHATNDLAAEVLRTAQKRLEAAERQRRPYEKRGMPEPGEDPELIAIMREVLGEHLTGNVSPAKWKVLIERVRQYLTQENKRKNLLGEGFEDVIGAVLRRTLESAAFDVHIRAPLHDLPGFNRPRQGEKQNKVDVAILRPNGGMRTLVNAKWSLRADREKQFAADYADYLVAESERLPFEYVFVTNEFDPARLMRACEHLAGNQYMFAQVVHINPDAIRATYSDASGGAPHGKGRETASMSKVLKHIDTGRLIGFDRWVQLLGQGARSLP